MTRLSYYGVRYYDNLLLGWTQAGPMYRFVPDAAWDERAARLLYAFSGNNPLRYVDPDGRSWVGAIKRSVVAVGTAAARVERPRPRPR
ncbi:MAG: hypothetical protein HS111_20945 [Kofleriaceae bacterium]|nr:hypothetical protein [Kofleriaceae bacterium]